MVMPGDVRSDSAGVARVTVHFFSPVLASYATIRLSTLRTTTTSAPTAGADSTSLDACAFQTGLPLPSNARIWPLTPPTTQRAIGVDAHAGRQVGAGLDAPLLLAGGRVQARDGAVGIGHEDVAGGQRRRKHRRAGFAHRVLPRFMHVQVGLEIDQLGRRGLAFLSSKQRATCHQCQHAGGNRFFSVTHKFNLDLYNEAYSRCYSALRRAPAIPLVKSLKN